MHMVDRSSCVAISGLGGHAFGSFKERQGQHMWLRDSLPRDLDGARIVIHGHDSQLSGSHSFQDLEALASRLRSDLEYLQDSSTANGRTIPLIFIAHSLGGLVLKKP